MDYHSNPFRHRKSTRLHHYDYATAGAYFVTICTQNRHCLLADADQCTASLEIDRMLRHWYFELEKKYPDMGCDAFIAMPNHVHLIVFLFDEPPFSNLPAIIQWFKTMTTNEYITGVKRLGWKPFDKRLWQRNYYERVIRDERELFRIQEYIATNPENWHRDPANPTL
jgi:REP element-mobilizing transposase RayT